MSHTFKSADEDMHEAWTPILAGEGNALGSFSIRPITTVAYMQSRDATTFAGLCQYTWHTNRRPPDSAPQFIVVRFGVPNAPMVRRITFNALKDLESFGLVTRGNLTIGDRVCGGRRVFIHAGDPDSTAILKTGDGSYEVPMGEVSFTTIGAQLSNIIDVANPPAEYVDARFHLWQ